MSRIAVTGASGFIGRHLCRRLIREGHHVTAMSRSGTDFPNARNVTLDFTRSSHFAPYLENVDVVFHLGGRVHQMTETGPDPLAVYRKINRDATRALAEQAALQGVRRFVFVSSILVNGNRTEADRPFSERDTPRPANFYAISKHEAETELRELGRATGLEITVIRPPLVYGREAKGNFSRLLKLVETGIPLPLGAIDNKRSLIYVHNLVDALIVCAVHPKAANNTYLVSDGTDVSTPELIRAIASTNGQHVRLLPVPVSAMKFACNLIGKGNTIDKLAGSLRLDSSRIHRELGWVPPSSFEKSLAATLAKDGAASERMQARSY